jgi:hypothetical protein
MLPLWECFPELSRKSKGKGAPSGAFGDSTSQRFSAFIRLKAESKTIGFTGFNSLL